MGPGGPGGGPGPGWGPGGPGWWGLGPGGPGPGWGPAWSPPGPGGFFGGFIDGLCGSISACLSCLCCCWLFEDCFGQVPGGYGPPGGPAPPPF